MTDINNPRLLYLKGLLLLLGGGLAAGLLLYDSPSIRTAILLAIAVWCFCRSYYFAFYVVEYYVDANYRFAGLGSFIAYIARQRFGWKNPPGDET